MDKKKKGNIKIKDNFKPNEFKEYANSSSKRIKNIFFRQKKAFKTIDYLVPLKEPVLFLMRSNQEVEFHEEVKGKHFNFVNSEGDKQFIKLNLLKLHKFNYGTQTFKGYIAHESNILCYPEKPLHDCEEISEIYNKAQRDNSRRAQNISNWTDAVTKILIYGALAYAIYMGAMWMFPSEQAVAPVTKVAQEVAKNVTILK
jgi:hypothetical protein